MSENKEPTNSDLMQANLSMMKEVGRIGQRLEDVASIGEKERAKIYEQTAKTNGRVNKIESWINDFKIRRDERNKMKDESGLSMRSFNTREPLVDPDTFKKFLIALTGLLTILATYIGIKIS